MTNPFPSRAPRLPVVLHARVATGSGGGPEKTSLDAPRHLASLGYRGVCAYMRPPGDAAFQTIAARAAARGAPLEVIDDRGAWDARVAADLLRLCRRERVAIWHGHDYKSNLLGLLLRRFWPMRLASTAHGWVGSTGRERLYYALDRACLRHYERVLCVSPDLLECCRAAGVPRQKCLLVENAIDAREYRRTLDRGEAKRRLGFRSGRVLIGAAGRLAPEKDFETLVRAIDQLLRQGLPVELAIAGEGERRARLAALIARLSRRKEIRLLGHRGDMAEFYQALDIFCLSSRREGLPNVLLEALALETPVAATRVAGVPSVLEHEVNGLLVEPGDATALAQALARLATDVELRESLAAAGRRTIVERYCFAARMKRVAAAYDELLGRGGGR
jgi:glycosyltransferase involved in cell wall biosynthesis